MVRQSFFLEARMQSRLALVLTAAVVGCGGGGGGSKDMAVVTNNKDMTMAPVNCDVVKQDCGAGKRCVAAFDGQGGASGSCIADGTVAAGGTCMFGSDPTTLFDDNCKAGYTCDDTIGTGTAVCRKYCGADSDCAMGEKCGDLTSFYGLANPPGFGWCLPSCTPFSTAAGNCASGFDCGESYYIVEQTDPTNPTSGFFFCKKTGNGVVYASCDDGMGSPSDALCGAGLWCFDINAGNGNADFRCLQNCDTPTGTHACDQPPADAGNGGITLACVNYDNTTNGAGFCFPM
jgi:hypothetical protein